MCHPGLRAKCHLSCATNLDTYVIYFPLRFSESLDMLVFDIQSFSLFLLLLGPVSDLNSLLDYC